MTKNKKLITDILVLLRDTDKNSEELWQDCPIKKCEPEDYKKYIKLLYEQKYIEIIDTSSKDGTSYIPQQLTVKGHDYLEQLETPWWKKIIKKIITESGKIFWSVIGALVTVLALYLLNNVFPMND